MKLTYARRYRRSASKARENAMFKKDGQHEHTFFSAPTHTTFFKPFVGVQRKCAHCEAEDKKVNRMADTKEEEKKVQRVSDKTDEKLNRAIDVKEEDKKLQKMPEKKEEEKSLQRATDNKEEDKKIERKEAASSKNNADVTSYIHNLNGKGQQMPEAAQAFFEERMDHDFGNVKIHTGTEAEDSAKKVKAKAFTVGPHIVFAKGQYNPASAEGKKLLAHELAHVVQNGEGAKLNKKEGYTEKEEQEFTLSGGASSVKNKSANGNCEGVSVHGQADFNPQPSTFSVKGGKTRTAPDCETCVAPDCITATGTIVSVFKSKPTITLPSVPDGLSACERNAVSRFINTTLRQHEAAHVAAFKKYDGKVNTPFSFTGCRSDLDAHVQSIHDGIDAQRSTAAIAQSDLLDPFIRPIPCNCE